MLSNSAAIIMLVGCVASGMLLFALVTFIGECLDRREQRRNATTSVLHVADTAAASVFIDVIASVHVDDAASPAASVVIDVERLQKLQEIGSVAAAEDESDSCVICYEEFKAKERLRVMPLCAHRFHIDCIDTWLLSHSSCPTCRCQVLEKGFSEP